MSKTNEILEVLQNIDRKLSNILAVIKTARIKDIKTEGDK